MTLTLTKFKQAIDLAENLAQLDYVIEKINTTSQINRRTKTGRDLTQKLLKLANDKAQLLINQGEQPF
ncbi:MAG TPA: hypothetical protein PLS91_01320 [Candidatus Paceibacterota bacterium]|nr:hypothetical protein [Candidatus Paceibacterota bacterium]